VGRESGRRQLYNDPEPRCGQKGFTNWRRSDDLDRGRPVGPPRRGSSGSPLEREPLRVARNPSPPNPNGNGNSHGNCNGNNNSKSGQVTCYENRPT